MTITLTREEAQQVLDALEWNLPVIEDFGDKEQLHEHHKAIESLRARLVQPEPYKQPEDNRLLMQAYRAIHEKQPEPEPVAWVENLTDAQPHAVTDLKYCSVAQHERGEHLKYIPLYADPTPCQTCEALARTVMMDQTSHDTAPPQREWQGLTDEEVHIIIRDSPLSIFRAIEAKLKEKNG